MKVFKKATNNNNNNNNNKKRYKQKTKNKHTYLIRLTCQIKSDKSG